MTIYEAIIVAAKIRLCSNLDELFRPRELREICDIPQGSFSPIFKGMRTDPGTAPLVHERARGLFIQIKRGLYQLSEKGKITVGETTPYESPIEIHLSNLLEENGYWSALDEHDDRKRTLREVVQRKGQPTFRLRLLNAYQSRCTISDCDAVPALEAAHISRYLGALSNTTKNGLLLRADLHTLFDLNLIAIEPKSLTVQISKSLMTTSYASFHMNPISLPKDLEHYPDKNALELRWSEFIRSENEIAYP